MFSSIGMVAAAFCNASKDVIALASQFTDSESFPISIARKVSDFDTLLFKPLQSFCECQNKTS